MPAWIAGIQVRRMRPETSMSAWIPALHAGMTQSRVILKLNQRPSTSHIFKGITTFKYTARVLLSIFETQRNLYEPSRPRRPSASAQASIVPS